jgi:arylsulfatase A-like enzyme
MERAGELENTVILFTSDHGESLDEHGYFFNHGDFVYGPAANVPLLWREPDGGVEALRRAPATLVDCLPVLLSLVTGEEKPPSADGTLPADGARPLFGESGFCRFPDLNDRLGWLLPPEIAQNPGRIPDWSERWEPQANRAKQRFVEAAGFKLVLSPRREGDLLELFDLERDPGETNDVAARFSGKTDSLEAELRRWIERGEGRETLAGERVLDDATLEGMKSLGYVGN